MKADCCPRAQRLHLASLGEPLPRIVAELAQRAEKQLHRTQRHCAGLALQNEKIGFNPVRLDEVNTRLNLLYTLQQNTASTVGELHGAGG